MADDFDFLDAISSEPKSGGAGPRCPGCGQEVSAGAVLCIGCGFNLRGGESLATQRGAGGTDPTLKIAVVAGALLVVVILVLAFMMMTGGDPEPTKPPTVATAPVFVQPTKPKTPDAPAPTEAELAAQAKAEAEAEAAAALAAQQTAADQARMKAETEAAARQKLIDEAKAREEAARLAAEKARMEAERKFQQSVNTAIKKSQEYLLNQFNEELGGFSGKYPEYIGESALATYALLKSGVSPNDPLVTISLKNMVKYAYGKPGTDKRGTYNCGIVMLALDELRESYARMEKDTASSSTESADARRNRLMIKGAMRKLALGLNRNQQTGKSFSYGGGAAKHGHDMSIHQYAILGMWAAYRSGVKLVPGFWKQQVEYLLAQQHEDGGFGYRIDKPSNGSMTTAGVGSLAICYLMLHEQRLMRQQFIESPGDEPAIEDVAPTTDLEKAIAKGFEYLAAKGGLGVNNPYYTYGLERTCALTQTKTLNGKDWYRTMAVPMITAQRPDGSWFGRFGETCSTSWNLLFLSKSTEKLFKDPIYEEVQSPGEGDGPVIGEGQKVDMIEAAPEGEGEPEGESAPGAGALDGGDNRDFKDSKPAPPAPGNPTAPGVNTEKRGGGVTGALPTVRGLIPEEAPDRTK